MNWTQPICGLCYNGRAPGREPHRIKPEFAETERCCDCGTETQEGIYCRVDPRTVAYPKLEERDAG